MSDNTQADIIVTGQGGTTSIENKWATLAQDSSSITPTTITAMEGFDSDLSLRRHPTVSDVITKLQSAQGNVSLANYHPNWTNLNALGNTMQTQSDKQLVSNTQFGTMFAQATGHVESSQQLKVKADFMANTNYPDYGSGITSNRDLLDQGMSTSFGDLNAAAKAMSATKGVYDPSDMPTYGTADGLFKSLKNNKLSNASGLTQQFKKFGVDTDQVNDPAYQDQVTNALKSITDRETLSTVADQFDLRPSVVTAPSTTFGADAAPIVGPGGGGIESLNDFLDTDKVTLGTDLTGLKDGLQYSDLGQKLSSMGASFEDPDNAARMMEQMGIPEDALIADYNAPTTMSTQMGGLTLNTMTGTGTGLAGLPNVRDFFPACANTPEITALQTQLDTDFGNASITTVDSQITNATTLLAKAGIDLDTPPAKNLGHTMAFGTNLHRYGADDINNPTNTTAFGAAVAPGEPRGGYAGIDGVNDFGKIVSGKVNTDLQSGFLDTSSVLTDMANTSNKYGQSVIASLSEGKNKALMQQNGILPLNYGPNLGKF
jgi:hypothetical protein